MQASAWLLTQGSAEAQQATTSARPCIRWILATASYILYILIFSSGIYFWHQTFAVESELILAQAQVHSLSQLHRNCHNPDVSVQNILVASLTYNCACLLDPEQLAGRSVSG